MMEKRPRQIDFSSPGWRIATSIRACLIEKGWETGELARLANISRTTLYHLLQGTTRHPRFSTVRKIAQALDLPPHTLCPGFFMEEIETVPNRTSQKTSPVSEKHQKFNRASNSYIKDVLCDQPELFSGWNENDWDELYSTVGVGGALTSAGVQQAAADQNKKRELIFKLSVVLETDLADVAENFVETLYQKIQPAGNLEQTKQLQQLLGNNTKPTTSDSNQSAND